MGKPTWLTPALGVAVVCSGLGGAIFTWWMNREEPLLIGYVLTSTSTGGDVTTNSLVQGLKLRIGDQDIPVIHTHVISLSRDSGYADSAVIALTFPKPIQVFGEAFTAPSVLHHIGCDRNGSALVCTIGPLDGQGNYQIAMATDSAEVPAVSTAGRNISVATLEQITKERQSLWNPLTFAAYAGLMIVLLPLMFWFGILEKKYPLTKPEDINQAPHY